MDKGARQAESRKIGVSYYEGNQKFPEWNRRLRIQKLQEKWIIILNCNTAATIGSYRGRTG
jgi:hypothetical protein